MQEIRSVSAIKDREEKGLMDYYVLLQSHIEEARRADLEEMLLIQDKLVRHCPDVNCKTNVTLCCGSS